VLDYCTAHGIGFIPFFPLAAATSPTGRRVAVADGP
jgi:hypothetical protein